jgi:hypothetical protein
MDKQLGARVAAVLAVLLFAGALTAQILSPIFRGGGSDVLTLTATTTGASQAVTIQQLTLQVAATISWGDGSSEAISAGFTGTRSHTYESAGTYPIRVTNARRITHIDLRDARLGGLNTAQLRNSPIDRFYITAITASVIRSTDMAAWRPTTWLLFSMPAGTYSIASADMAAWRPTEWRLFSMPAGTYSIASADMAAWRPTGWQLYSMPAGTYSIASADMAAWRPTGWRLYSMPAGTYSIASADMAAWRPTEWRLFSMPAGGTYSIASADMAAWNTTQYFYCHSNPAGSYTVSSEASFSGLTAIRELQLQGNSLNQASVDMVLAGLAAGTFSYATPSLALGGNNAAPSSQGYNNSDLLILMGWSVSTN